MPWPVLAIVEGLCSSLYGNLLRAYALMVPHTYCISVSRIALVELLIFDEVELYVLFMSYDG